MVYCECNFCDFRLPFIFDDPITPNCPWNWFWTGSTSIFITSSITSSILEMFIVCVRTYAQIRGEHTDIYIYTHQRNKHRRWPMGWLENSFFSFSLSVDFRLLFWFAITHLWVPWRRCDFVSFLVFVQRSANSICSCRLQLTKNLYMFKAVTMAPVDGLAIVQQQPGGKMLCFFFS